MHDCACDGTDDDAAGVGYEVAAAASRTSHRPEHVGAGDASMAVNSVHGGPDGHAGAAVRVHMDQLAAAVGRMVTGHPRRPPSAVVLQSPGT